MATLYTCAECGETFEGWDEHDAQAALARTFPGFPHERCDQVCGGCYEKILTRNGLKAS